MLRKLIGLLWFFPLILSGQQDRFLALERAGNPVNKRINVGTVITYQVKEGQGWTTAEIVDIDAANGLIVFPTRSIPIASISALRKEVGWSRGVGKALVLFGLNWSALALVGNYTDDNPNTNYRTSDGIVTAAGVTLGLALPRLFRYHTTRLGEKRRLRPIDLDPIGTK